MKLLLTSAGFTDQLITDALLGLIGKPFSQTNLAFIPTAATIETGDKSGLINDLNNSKALGFRTLDIVDIAALPESYWLPRLLDADVLLFGGGNTYSLMDWVRRSGLDKKLPELLSQRIYVGISAGSIIACPDINIAGWDPNWDKNIINIQDTKGLAYVPFLISPHYVLSDLPILQQGQRELGLDIFGITDNQAIVVDGANWNIIGEGPKLKLTAKG